MNFFSEIQSTPYTEREISFGSWIHEKRTALNWTQDELLERAGNIITKSYLSQLENNRSNRKNGGPAKPSLEKVDALAGALGASINEARRLTGYAPDDAEMPRDEVADRFTFVLARYRQLTPESRDYVDRQIENTVNFALGLQEREHFSGEHIETGLEQEIKFISDEELLKKLPVLTRADLRKKYAEKARVRKG